MIPQGRIQDSTALTCRGGFCQIFQKKKKNTVMLKPHEVKNILVPGRGAVLAPYSLDPILFAIAIYFSKIS